MRIPRVRSLLLLLFVAAGAGWAAEGRVDVILWFDTEDYLSLPDDDATLRLARMLSERGIRATFKVVGEKARVLEQRGRTDVIAALQKHAIGYHANLHSVHPTPTEYLANCGWLDGVAEFVRREGGGAADVRRIFAVPTLACYGQPGSSWGAQAIGALPSIGVAPQGVPCYVDEGSHVGLNHQPFWYAGALVVYNLGPNLTRMELHNPAALEPAKEKVTAIAARLRANGGGLISIYYHPCEWIHRQFWDGVNFARGANPPRERWRPPPLRTAEETDGAFERFGAYIDHIRALPGVHWITATDLPSIYPDSTRTAGATEADWRELCRRLRDATELDYQEMGGRVYSVADQFELTIRAAAAAWNQPALAFPARLGGLLGPDEAAGPTRQVTADGLATRDAVRDVANYLAVHRRVPARVFVGSNPVSPAAFVVGLASALAEAPDRPAWTADTKFNFGRNAGLATERHIAADTPGLFGGWVIHPEGFRAPKVMEVARLQAWTLKPALRFPPP